MPDQIGRFFYTNTLDEAIIDDVTSMKSVYKEITCLKINTEGVGTTCLLVLVFSWPV